MDAIQKIFHFVCSPPELCTELLISSVSSLLSKAIRGAEVLVEESNADPKVIEPPGRGSSSLHLPQ